MRNAKPCCAWHQPAFSFFSRAAFVGGPRRCWRGSRRLAETRSAPARSSARVAVDRARRFPAAASACWSAFTSAPLVPCFSSPGGQCRDGRRRRCGDRGWRGRRRLCRRRSRGRRRRLGALVAAENVGSEKGDHDDHGERHEPEERQASARLAGRWSRRAGLPCLGFEPIRLLDRLFRRRVGLAATRKAGGRTPAGANQSSGSEELPRGWY